MKLHGHRYAAAALVILGGCTHGSGEDALLGKWINHRVVARRPAIVSIEFLPKDTVTISAIDAFAAAGWHPATTSTGQYQVIAPNRLKITEELGSVVVDYHVDGTRLVLSGDGLERLLGKTEPPQVLDETSQRSGRAARPLTPRYENASLRSAAFASAMRVACTRQTLHSSASDWHSLR